MSEDLRPLREDAGSSQAVRNHLRDAVDHSAAEYDTEAGLARHRELLEAGAALPDWAGDAASPAGAGASSGTLLTKLVTGLLVVAAAGGLALALWPEAPAPMSTAPQAPGIAAERPVSDSALQPPDDAPPSPSQPSEVTAEPVPPDRSLPPPKRRRDPTATARSADTQPDAPSGEDAVQREVALMGRARALLPRDAAATLKLLRAAEHEFPSGFFGEEREALIVLALARLDRTERARERGEAFLAKHPAGAFNRRVRRALAELDHKREGASPSRQ